MNRLKITTLSNLLTQHRGDDSQVTLPSVSHLQGMMHDFIDLIFCWQGQYYVADYTSTHLGKSTSDYIPQTIGQSIRLSHFDLQYLIHSLALHRCLCNRMENHNPTQHFSGGLLPLFEKHETCQAS